MSSSRCTKSILVDGSKLSFASYSFYQMVDGHVRRVRHRKSLNKGNVLAVPKGSALKDSELANALIRGKAPEGCRLGTSHPMRIKSEKVVLGEGGSGWRHSLAFELHALASSSRRTSTLYESVDSRATRARSLAAKLTRENPLEISRIVESLRKGDNSRSGSIALAIDAANNSHPDALSLLEKALTRPDDVAAALAYQKYAYATIPSSVRKGLANAATRLYSEDSVALFNRSNRRGLTGEPYPSASMTDVVRLTHPKPSSTAQNAVFAYLAGGGSPSFFDSTKARSMLPRLAARADAFSMNASERKLALEKALESSRRALREGRRVSTTDLGPLSALGFDEMLTWAGGIDVERSKARSELKDALDRATVSECPRWSLDYLLLEKPSLASKVLESYVSTHPELSKRLQGAYAELPEEVRENIINWAHTWSSNSSENHSLYGLQEQVRDLKGLPLAVRKDIVEVALPSMSSKQILRYLTDVNALDDTAIDLAAEKLQNKPNSNSGSSLQPSDVLLAAKATLKSKAATDTTEEGEADHYLYGGWVYPSGKEPDEGLSDALNPKLLSSLDSTLSSYAAELPDLSGRRVLVAVDRSGSMVEPLSAGDSRNSELSGLSRSDAAALFASMIASRCDQVDVIAYDTEAYPVSLDSDSILKDSVRIAVSGKGGGTDTWGVISSTFDNHDLVVVLTDEQTSITSLDRERALKSRISSLVYNAGVRAGDSSRYDEVVDFALSDSTAPPSWLAEQIKESARFDIMHDNAHRDLADWERELLYPSIYYAGIEDPSDEEVSHVADLRLSQVVSKIKTLVAEEKNSLRKAAEIDKVRVVTANLAGDEGAHLAPNPNHKSVTGLGSAFFAALKDATS